ncbi:MAG TPA: hypothetical protein VN752_06715 [Solirubrobacterales bacterium]|nr:hypothetical protein [Solirubrobacterales bacterium]
MTPEPALNKTEVWIAEHSIRILAVAALLIAVGAFFVVKIFLASGETAREVDVLKPQVTKVIRAASVCSLDATRRSQESRECAMRMRIALINCRRYSRCRAALLSAITYPLPAKATAPSSTELEPEGGDAVQQPSNQGHQPPGPGKGPSGGNGGNGQGGGQGAAPAPSPGASGPAAAEHGPPAESPGNGAQGSQGGESSSGVGVELCALERTCVDVEVGVDPKGLIP